jgi:NADPH2:quinone reductase
MKSIRLHSYGDPDQLRYEDSPDPKPGPGELLVKVAAAGVNPVDFKLRQGVFKDWMPLTFPAVLGGDFAGTVVAVGPGVNPSRIGERTMGMVKSDGGGCYAELMIVDQAAAVPVPDGLDLLEAAALPITVLTGCQLAEEGVQIRDGERILVTGAAGGVGRAAVSAAAARGAKVVAGVRKLPVTSIAGASATLLLSDQAALKAAGPFDAVADTVGGQSAEALFAHLKAGGRFASVVFPQPVAPAGTDRTVIPVIVKPDNARLRRFANDMVAGRAKLPAVERYPLRRAADAHRRLEAGGVDGKVVLVP